MLQGGWNLGGYGYLDRRRSGESGEYYNQVTLGAEALGRDWDVRGNAYLPQGDRVRDLGSATSGGASTASIVGTTVQVTTGGTTTTTTEERALRGYDAEVGWRVPLFEAEDSRQLRLYAGGFRFKDDVLKVSGPRARAEIALTELPGLWRGAQLIAGAEAQDDNVRGSQVFVSLRIRVPLGGGQERLPPLDFQERRMTAPVMRDVDIVAQRRSFVSASTPATVETATATAAGQAITVLASSGTNGAALPAAITAAGANSTVILSGNFDTAGTITTLSAGQTLMGAGSVSVRTPSGRTATLTTPAATLTGNIGATSYTVVMANSSTLTGLTINSTVNTSATNALGVRVDNVSGARVIGNTINATFTGGGGGTAHGIDVLNASSNILISGNTVTSVTNGSIALGIQVNGAAHPSATISGNTLSASGGTTRNATVTLSNANILSGSSGNTAVAGNCDVSTTGVGATVGFTNAAPCGP